MPRPRKDLREFAAERWKQTHGYKQIHDAYVDPQFRAAFDRYVKNPNDKNRKMLGLRTGSTREKKELELVRTLKLFGDTP